MRISRNLKNQIIIYVREYAERVSKSRNPLSTLKNFKAGTAAMAAVSAMRQKDSFTEAERQTIEDAEFIDYLTDFFEEKLPINYLVITRGIGYYEAKALLTDKGTDFFPELKGYQSSFYRAKNNDYPATDKQIQSIVKFGVTLEHANELSGREASLILSCLINDHKTRPAYFSYYIKGKTETGSTKAATYKKQ